MKKLKIAQFVTSEIVFPPPRNFFAPFMPMIDIAYKISEELTNKGHRITFFGPTGSKSSNFRVGKLNIPSLSKQSLINEVGVGTRERIINLFDQYSLGQIIRQHQNEPFDLIHVHNVDKALPIARLFPNIPFVFTLHDQIFSWRAKMIKMFKTPNQYFLSISKFQQTEIIGVKFIANVYNGIELNHFPFSRKTQDHLLWVGRIIPEKGLVEAIETANLVGRYLLIIGPKNNVEYWRDQVEPILGKNKYISFIEHNKLYQYFGHAKAFLMPIMWEEPFGLVVPEANACGTPVVAFARGSMPELIKDGYNGYLVKPGDVKAMAKAVQRIYDMPEDDYQQMRLNCRKHVEENFTIEKMAENYEKVYYKIVNEELKKKS